MANINDVFPGPSETPEPYAASDARCDNPACAHVESCDCADAAYVHEDSVLCRCVDCDVTDSHYWL